MVVRATDTDILVILLHHIEKIPATVWMDVGTSSNRRYVNLTAIAEEIGQKVCMALPGFHAFTGCDYTAAFIRKDKKRPFLKLQESNYVDAFAALATGPADHATCKTIENFTANMYGAKKTISLTKYRFMFF